MAEDLKFTAYLERARAVKADLPSEAVIAAWKARHQGCIAQFKELAVELQAAEASKDAARVSQAKAILKENYELRARLVADLAAAGVAVDDNR